MKPDYVLGEYRKGYFKALVDVKNFVERFVPFLKRYKAFNQRGIIMFLQFLIDNSDEFMTYGEFFEMYAVMSADMKKFIRFQKGESK